MLKGFYNLTSGMLSQGRRLDVLANNMTNTATTGYKAERYTDSTFKEYIVSRVGNKDKSNSEELGNASYILAPSQLYTDYTQGYPEPTGMPLDFSIEGDGFFAIQTPQGVAYTRSGNFSLDEEGYLCLPAEGRVLDSSGNPIQLGTDQITADGNGAIYSESGNYLARLGVYSFADNNQLEKNPRGLFTGTGAQAANVSVHWKALERSNVDLVQQMVDMISSQRALQSAAQVSKMYDQLLSKATNDLGRL
jgi:flagellar basal-body rod protein FlgG